MTMQRIASASISGPEARGQAVLFETDINFVLQLEQLWVAPGAPDVWLALTSDASGRVSPDRKDLAMLGYHRSHFEVAFPKEQDPRSNPTLLIYCKKFGVHFGHGRLNFGS